MSATLMDVYWAGRATMVRRQDQVPIYNAVFKLFFLDIDESNADPRKLTPKIIVYRWCHHRDSEH